MGDLTILNAETHGALRWRGEGSFDFVRQWPWVPITVGELEESALVAPVAVLRVEGKPQLGMLLGRGGGANAMVDSVGRWRGFYVPAAIRVYPFKVVKSGEQFAVAADLTAPTFNDANGRPLFEQGQATPLLNELMRMLTLITNDQLRTQRWLAQVETLGVLKPLSLAQGEAQGKRIAGVEVISEDELLKLGPDRLPAELPAKTLTLLHAMALSLRHLRRLFAEPASPVRAAETPSPLAEFANLLQ